MAALSENVYGPPTGKIDQGVVLAGLRFVGLGGAHVPGLVVTNTCDLSPDNKKQRPIIAVCVPMLTLRVLVEKSCGARDVPIGDDGRGKPPSKNKRGDVHGDIANILKNKQEVYHYLPACVLEEQLVFDESVCWFDYSSAFTEREVEGATHVARVMPPYRESASLRFARYHMRVGLEDWSKSEINEVVDRYLDPV